MSIIIREYIKAMPYILAKPNIESDVYNNCLLIQKCVNDMKKNSLISKIEEDVLVALFKGFNFSEISRLLSLDRKTILTVTNRITDRIAFILGGDFSDPSLIQVFEEMGYKEFDSISILSRKEHK